MSGTCNDDYTKQLFKTPATIDGSFEENRIYFIKRYPSLLTIDKNGQTIIIPDEPSLSIQYAGYLRKGFLTKKIYFEGEWSIDGSFLDENGNANYFSSSGRWKMTKSRQLS